MIKLGVDYYFSEDDFGQAMIGDSILNIKHKEIIIDENYVINKLIFNINNIYALLIESPFGIIGIRLKDINKHINWDMLITCELYAVDKIPWNSLKACSEWVNDNKEEIFEHVSFNNDTIEIS